MPLASEDGKKRVEAAVAIFGHVPQDIFAGQRISRHSLRNQKLSAREVEMLKQLSIASQQQEASEPDAGATVDPGSLV